MTNAWTTDLDGDTTKEIPLPEDWILTPDDRVRVEIVNAKFRKLRHQPAVQVLPGDGEFLRRHPPKPLAVFHADPPVYSGEIVRFDTKVGMTSGTKAFHDLKLVTRASEDNFAARQARQQQTGERPPLKFEVKDPAGVTLANGITSKPEADWLVKAMSESLGR